MRTRDVAFVGLKLVAILIARQAVFPLAQVIGENGASGWRDFSNLLSFFLFLGIGFALWAYAGTLADSMTGSVDPLTPSQGSSITVRNAATAAAALMGLWILTHGVIAAITALGDFLSARQIDASSGPLRVGGAISNPLRTQAEWQIISGVVQAGIGLVLVAMRATVASAITPDA